jgi:hypothetical protein
MDQGLATLIAALIAALASLMSWLSMKPAEIRTANRKTLEMVIYELSTSVHQLIATSNILLKNRTEESRGNWKEKAEVAKEMLKQIRPKIRYSLWGIDESLQTLTRLPDYTLYTLADTKVAQKVVRRGSRLGDAIDRCIRDCYLNGRAPSLYERWTIRFFDWHFRKARDDYKAQRSAANTQSA